MEQESVQLSQESSGSAGITMDVFDELEEIITLRDSIQEEQRRIQNREDDWFLLLDVDSRDVSSLSPGRL